MTHFQESRGDPPVGLPRPGPCCGGRSWHRGLAPQHCLLHTSNLNIINMVQLIEWPAGEPHSASVHLWGPLGQHSALFAGKTYLRDPLRRLNSCSWCETENNQANGPRPVHIRRCPVLTSAALTWLLDCSGYVQGFIIEGIDAHPGAGRYFASRRFVSPLLSSSLAPCMSFKPFLFVSMSHAPSIIRFCDHRPHLVVGGSCWARSLGNAN